MHATNRGLHERYISMNISIIWKYSGIRILTLIARLLCLYTSECIKRKQMEIDGNRWKYKKAWKYGRRNQAWTAQIFHFQTCFHHIHFHVYSTYLSMHVESQHMQSTVDSTTTVFSHIRRNKWKHGNTINAIKYGLHKCSVSEYISTQIFPCVFHVYFHACGI